MKITKDIGELWLELNALEEFPKDFNSNEKWRYSTCEKEDFTKLESILNEYPNKNFKSWIDFTKKKFEEGSYIKPSKLLEGAFSIHLGKNAKWKYAIPRSIDECFKKDYEPIYLAEQLFQRIETHHNTLNQLERERKKLNRIQKEIEEDCFPEEVIRCLLEEEKPNRRIQPYWWGGWG
jgi:transposase